MVCTSNMVISIVILLCVSVTIAYNETIMDSGVARIEYQIYPNCSVSIPVSEVETYQELIAKATKLVYVDFEYANGIKWTVIKVLDERWKYLLKLGHYKTLMMLSLYTLAIGIEYTSVTLDTSTKECLMDTGTNRLVSLMLVSKDFKKTCTEYITRPGSLFSTQLVCSQTKGYEDVCAGTDQSGNDIVKVLDMPDADYLFIVITLMFAIIFGLVMTMTKRYLQYIYSICTVYTCSDNDGISIEENNNYLIEKNSVPSGIFSTLLDIYLTSILPSVDLYFKNRITVKTPFLELKTKLLFLNNLLCIYILLAFVINSVLMIAYLICILLVLVILFLVKAWLGASMFVINSNTHHLDSVLGDLRECSCFVLIILLCLTLPILPVYIVYKITIGYKRYRRVCVELTCREWVQYILTPITVLVWLIVCLYIAIILTYMTVTTLIGITMNSVPYLPLLMAGIVCWLKISSRLSNWYKCFFKTVLDNVTSMIEEKTLEASLLSRRDSFLIVQPWSSTQIQGRRFQINGTPIFINRKGTLKLTKTFFHKCVKVGKISSQTNPFRISAECLEEFIIAILFLIFIALIIKNFGEVGQLTTSLFSLAGGVFPFILGNFIVKDIPMSDIGQDKLFISYLKNLVKSYEESFEIASPSARKSETRNDTGQGYISRPEISFDGHKLSIKQSNFLSDGCELTTEESDSISDGQKLNTEPSDIVTEKISEKEVSSEISPLLSPITHGTELDEDPNYLDIK